MWPSEGGGDGREEVAAGVGDEGIRESGKDEGTPPPALQAPAHLIARVFSQLDCVDLLNCSLVCNWMSTYGIVGRDEELASEDNEEKHCFQWRFTTFKVVYRRQWYRECAELREGWKNEYLEARHLYGMSVKRESHPPSSTCSIRGVHSWCP